jgi:hypothetical protein
MTQTASYSLKSFTVMFLDHRGNRIGNPQTVGYKQAAIPPEPQNIPNGYSFVKWDNPNYNEVVSDMTVRQVIAWENPDFLVATSIESLTRNEAGDGYNVTVKIKGHPTKNASGKIIASLKTGDAGLLSEKMVSASVENFTKSAQPGNPDDDLIENIFVPYRGIITKAEVEVVGVLTDANTGVSDKTGAPIAAKAVITIDLNDQWSDWQTQDPGTNHEFVEGPVTRWHEKTREVKTSTTASLTGYDLYDTVKDVSAWSAWSRTNPASAANREIESRWVAPKYKTQYNYWGYRATKNGGNLYHFCDYLGKSIHGVTFSRRETGWQDNTLAFTSRSAQYCSHCGKTSYGYYGNYYYWVDTRQVQTAGGYYEYRYQDTTTTYYFEKWSDWSDWNYNGSTPAETSFKKVQTEQIYRYKDNLSTQQFYHYKRYKYLNMGNGNYYYTYTPAIVTDTLGYPGEWEYYRVPDAELAVLTVDNGITVYKTDNGDQWYQADVNNLGEFTQYIINETREDVNGKEISISGALAYSANKSAVIMVYKNYNTDPTEDQLEYIDHITLGANGEYALTFRPKEDPSRETGDFVVVVGVEGAVAPVYVETIYAPLPVYEVLFIDDNGEEIAKQMVHKGQAAELPEAIAKEGYTFIGWDRAATNVQTDLTVKAMYEKNTYSVVFIDWDNEFFDTVTFEHGDALVYPQEIEPNDGRLFTGWSKTDSDETVTTVTQNMIVTAKYDLAKYTVTFFDSDGIILKTQEVTHGEAADLPTQAIKSTEFQTFAFLERRHGIYNRRLIRLSGHAVCGRRSRPGGFSERRNIF